MAKCCAPWCVCVCAMLRVCVPTSHAAGSRHVELMQAYWQHVLLCHDATFMCIIHMLLLQGPDGCLMPRRAKI